VVGIKRAVEALRCNRLVIPTERSEVEGPVVFGPAEIPRKEPRTRKTLDGKHVSAVWARIGKA
jgi:hypothetical protein